MKEVSIQELLYELRLVSQRIDDIVVKLRKYQEQKLHKTMTEAELQEFRTLKQIISEIESIAA